MSENDCRVKVSDLGADAAEYLELDQTKLGIIMNVIGYAFHSDDGREVRYEGGVPAVSLTAAELERCHEAAATVLVHLTEYEHRLQERKAWKREREMPFTIDTRSPECAWEPFVTWLQGQGVATEHTRAVTVYPSDMVMVVQAMKTDEQGRHYPEGDAAATFKYEVNISSLPPRRNEHVSHSQRPDILSRLD